MSLRQFFYLISWDFKINHGWSFDCIRARLLLLEIRFEQLIHRNLYKKGKMSSVFWYLTRFFGSIFQWFLCNSNIPGSVVISRGLRLPHPQNIIVAGYAKIGEFCTIYHNVSIAWNGFYPVKPDSPKVGNKVLLGVGCIILGDVSIGDNVLLGAGSVITISIPDNSRVVSNPQIISSRMASSEAAEAGSERHIKDPYSIWR